MPRRIASCGNPVAFEHDGHAVEAERGEPLAAALVAAGRDSISRSPKLHRPRGPYCFRGACDGCLARVDGLPNQATCLIPALGGERVETQNVIGTRDADVMNVLDFFFPHGFDHHRMWAGVPLATALLQRVARSVSGLGTLPDRTARPKAAEHARIDALVVGGGASGLAASIALGGGVTWLADDMLELGGSSRDLHPEGIAKAISLARARGVRLMTRTTVIGLFRESDERCAILASDAGAHLVRARAIVLCTGRHDPVPCFPNNDLPGIYAQRAAACLASRGISLGARVFSLGTGPHIESLARRTSLQHLPPEGLVRVVGRQRLTGVLVRQGSRERRLRADALVVGGLGAPALELLIQAGARASFEHGDYRVEAPNGRVAPGVWCAGSVRDPTEAPTESGARAGRAISEELGLARAAVSPID